MIIKFISNLTPGKSLKNIVLNSKRNFLLTFKKLLFGGYCRENRSVSDRFQREALWKKKETRAEYRGFVEPQSRLI